MTQEQYFSEASQRHEQVQEQYFCSDPRPLSTEFLASLATEFLRGVGPLWRRLRSTPGW